MSTTSLDARTTTREAGRSLYDRLLAAIPVIVVAISIIVLYAVEAWLRKTPWLFSDEAEWTQISRSIAHTGRAARRGQPIYFKSLYAYMIAPAWWIHSTATAYAVIKYLNVIVMTTAAIPTYLLARMLVTKRSAFIVAVLAVLIPGMSYGSSIVIEVLAYPWYALCSWLIVRAVISKRRLDLGLAVGASIVAGFVRWPQFSTVAIAFAITAGVLWLIGPRGRAMRSSWSKADYVGAIALFYGALILFNRIILQHEPIWQLSTQYWKGRMVNLGLQAAFAFTVGLGILPVIGGFAALRVKERSDDPRYRAFAAYLGASIFCLGLYTAVKAAYLSTVFATLTEERNLIYLSPLLLIGTAIVFESGRISKWLVAGATALVLLLVLHEPFQLLFPYYEAPGFAIMALPTRNWHWTVQDLRFVLLGVLLLSLLALRFRRVAAVATAALVLGGGWMLADEIYMTHGIVGISNEFRARLPTKLDWVDADVHGRPVTYLGQEITDSNVVLMTEFWNRSIKHVESLDGSELGPGPDPVPNVVSSDGLLDTLDTPYVLADEGVDLQAKVVDSWANMRLYKRTGPWKLLDALQQVYADGWAPGWSTYTYFKPGQHGVLQLSIGRDGYTGPTDAEHPTGHATIIVGKAVLHDGAMAVGRDYEVKHLLVRNGQSQVVDFPVRQTPVRIVVKILGTIHVGNDQRNLGAQVGFKFIPK